ncbi:MAG: hypothetical protein NVS3B20_14140 [Polyangiales bacterium]
MNSTRWVVLASPLMIASSLALLAMGGACSSNVKSPSDEGGRDEFAGETRDTSMQHEPCDTKGRSLRVYKADDTLSSAKLNVTHVFAGSRELCSFADINGDGRVDVYSYFDENGRIRRRESSYSIALGLDEIALYKNGELDLVLRETNFDGKVDTWDHYQGGKLVRRERDKNGDGHIDEWWTFEPGTDNATIVQADPRTGKPDPTQTIKLGVGFNANANQPPAVVDYKRPPKGRDAGIGSSSADAGANSSSSPLAPTPSVVPATDGTFADAGSKKGSTK